MAMREVENEMQHVRDLPGLFALPHEWGPVAAGSCPVCGLELEHFDHAGRYTCYECGFYISTRVYEIIKSGTRNQKYTGPGISRGYGFGLIHFKNETPF
jgi:hypothetical protein